MVSLDVSFSLFRNGAGISEFYFYGVLSKLQKMSRFIVVKVQ